MVEMHSPGLLSVLVEEAIMHSLEKRVAQRQAAGKLMERLVNDGLLSQTKFLEG